jgi:hypothetical protein
MVHGKAEKDKVVGAARAFYSIDRSKIEHMSEAEFKEHFQYTPKVARN